MSTSENKTSQKTTCNGRHAFACVRKKLLHFSNDNHRKLTSILQNNAGQSTTEYALLVGVLVVVIIGAIAILGGQVSDLWDSITTEMAKVA